MFQQLGASDKLVRESYADQVYHCIKELNLSDRIKQGEKIVEHKIETVFGVGRTRPLAPRSAIDENQSTAADGRRRRSRTGVMRQSGQ